MPNYPAMAEIGISWGPAPEGPSDTWDAAHEQSNRFAFSSGHRSRAWGRPAAGAAEGHPEQGWRPGAGAKAGRRSFSPGPVALGEEPLRLSPPTPAPRVRPPLSLARVWTTRPHQPLPPRPLPGAWGDRERPVRSSGTWGSTSEACPAPHTLYFSPWCASPQEPGEAEAFPPLPEPAPLPAAEAPALRGGSGMPKTPTTNDPYLHRGFMLGL